jgi:hypothetical protein
VLFLILSVIIFSLKQWKKIFVLFFSVVFSFLVGLVLVIYGNIIPKIELIKLLVPLTILFLAIQNLLSSANASKHLEKYMLFFAILFGLFNGLGSSNNFLLKLGRNESELLPAIEVTLGMGISVFIIILGLTIVFALLRKIPKISKKNTTIISSIIIIGILIPIIVGQIFV